MPAHVAHSGTHAGTHTHILTCHSSYVHSQTCVHFLHTYTDTQAYTHITYTCILHILTCTHSLSPVSVHIHTCPCACTEVPLPTCPMNVLPSVRMYTLSHICRYVCAQTSKQVNLHTYPQAHLCTHSAGLHTIHSGIKGRQDSASRGYRRVGGDRVCTVAWEG